MLYKTGRQDENPADKTFLKICFVCKDVAKPGQEHLRNYGGIVCYSCRAFWRRSHQVSRRPNFVCKKSNQCTISVATRRRCQKCRYERCLSAGMNPDAVLDTEQKKVRFRKLLKKQQKILSEKTNSKVPIPSTLRYFSTTNHIEEGQQIKTKIPSYNWAHNVENSQPIFLKNRPIYQNLPSGICIGLPQTFNGSPPTSTDVHYPVFLPSRNDMDTDFGDSPLDLRIPEKGSGHSNFCSYEINLEEIADDFIRVMTKIGCPRTEYLIQKLMTLQSGFFEMMSVSKIEMKFLIDQLSRAFRLFAFSCSDFCILDPMDQQKLLARNTHTFIQLYMGQFLLVEPRHIPTSPGDPHPKKAWTNNFQQRLYLERFNAVTELFIPGANLDEYGVCISKLKSLPELSNFRQKAVVAYTILFDCDDKTVCSTNLNLNFIFDYYVRTCENCISFSSLTENLREMATFSTNNIEW